jgi:hypothetical protein
MKKQKINMIRVPLTDSLINFFNEYPTIKILLCDDSPEQRKLQKLFDDLLKEAKKKEK